MSMSTITAYYLAAPDQADAARRQQALEAVAYDPSTAPINPWAMFPGLDLPAVALFSATLAQYVVLPDDGTLTAADLTDHPLAVADAQAAAQQAATEQLQQMASADIPTFAQQIQSDAATISTSGWANLTSQQQHDIMLRVIQGFGSVMDAIQTHAVATGTLPPP